MSKVKAWPIGGDRIRSFIERVEKLIEERKAIQGDIRDVFSEAKGAGYDVATMRKVIALRGMDAADRAEQEALLDVYMHALGMIDRAEARLAAGESLRAVEAAEGVSKSKLHRLSQKRAEAENGTADTGEIEEARQEGRCGSASTTDCLLASAAGDQPAVCPSTPPQPEEPTTPACDGKASRPEASAEAKPEHAIDLTLPKFLDRRVNA